MFNPEILEILEKKYKEMPEGVKSVPLVGVPLLENFHLFKETKPDNVIFSFTDEAKKIEVYIGFNKK